MKTLLVIALLLSICAMLHAQAPGMLAVPAGPCGQDAAAPPAARWAADQGSAPGQAVAGPGVSLVTEPAADYAARSFTFEAWVRWPEEAAGRYEPEIVAEARGERWSWTLAFNDVGCPQVNWGAGRYEFQVEGQMEYDIMRPGRWYHVAAVFNTPDGGGAARVMIFITEEGFATPFCVQVGGTGTVAPAEPGERVRFAVGRSVDAAGGGPARMRVGSAAFYTTARPTAPLTADEAPAEIPADIAGTLPEGVRIDGDFEMASLGGYGTRADGTILFSSPPLTGNRNYWYAFRVRGARGRTLVFQYVKPDAMSTSPWVNEDGLAAIAGPYGTRNWVKPSGYVHRRVDIPEGEPRHFSFAHTFTSDDAIVAGCPMVTTAMADAWLDEVAVKELGARIVEIGRSPNGHPLRVAEVGNPDAPLVWWQNGQHSAVERFGYHMAVTAFELAARDEELMRKTRWLILPVVNVDSYMVSAVPGEPNYNRVWQASGTHPTISAIRRFLEQQTARTGTLAAFDCHAGTVQRGNTLAMGGSVQGLFERYTREAGVTFRRGRAVDWPAQPPAAPADLDGWHPGPDSATFNGFGVALPLVRAAYTMELSTIVHRTPQGVGPMSIEGMSNDGVGVYKALKRLIDAPMPPPASQAPDESGLPGGAGAAPPARGG